MILRERHVLRAERCCGGGSLKFVHEAPKVVLAPVQRCGCPPLTASPTHTSMRGRCIPIGRDVLPVLRVRDCSEVGSSAVKSVAVDVVNLHAVTVRKAENDTMQQERALLAVNVDASGRVTGVEAPANVGKMGVALVNKCDRAHVPVAVAEGDGDRLHAYHFGTGSGLIMVKGGL